MPKDTREPEARKHGDAWRYFCEEMSGRRYGAEERRDAWLWFLSGWLAKADQRNSWREVAKPRPPR